MEIIELGLQKPEIPNELINRIYVSQDRNYLKTLEIFRNMLEIVNNGEEIGFEFADSHVK